MLSKYMPVLMVSLLISTIAFSQSIDERSLTHADVAQWHEISNETISSNGRWVVYQLESEEGDPELVVYDGVSGNEWRYPRGHEAELTDDSRFLVFTISPHQDSLKAMRRQGIDKKDLSSDTLGLLNLNQMMLEKIPDLKKVEVPQKWAGWIFYQLDSTPADSAFAKKPNQKNGYHLMVRSLLADTTYRVPFVTDITLAEEKAAVGLVTTGVEDELTAGIYHWTPGAVSPVLVEEGSGSFKQIALSRQGARMAYLSNQDTVEQRVTPYTLQYWSTTADVRTLATDQNNFLPDDWRISENGRTYFAENGERLFFGTAPQPILEDTSLLDEEIVQVEVWTTQDQRLYPMQKVQMNRDKRRTWLAMCQLSSGKLMQLETEAIPSVSVGNEGNGRYALGENDEKYMIRTSWEGFPPAQDVYLIDLNTGNTQMIEEELRGYPSLSPEGKYAYWYSYPDSNWYAQPMTGGERIQLTENNKVTFYDETDDHPDYPRPYGVAGWTTNDDFIMIYDRYDVWQIDPTKEIRDYNLTNGRKMKRRSRYIRVDPEERAIEEVGPLLFHFFDETTKNEGYQEFNIHTGVKEVIEEGPYSYDRRPQKARDTDRWLFTREDFQTFPDLLYGRTLNSYEKISNANPQQDNFRWGTAELYDFVSLDGQQLQGMLIKPKDFDPDKKYPMIVNFYERSTDGLHRHRTPSFGRSTINYPFYVSRGYLIFNPDVPYKIGYPGESAFNSVMGGVQKLLSEGYVDEQRVALQGHSWGGYQIAHIVTKTNLFRCAESGAPVVNMISAYGGIRWGSGMSRMFQYEHTQSRIGGTLWEKPLLYIENSPIFSANKIETPLLILHNDEDGAVPWYQGIEFFVSLRRLGKPAWMLNYNGEPHWPLKPQNRRDFQTRMAQFFDYYLQDAAKPEWMETGVPAIEKGINQHLELLDDRH